MRFLGVDSGATGAICALDPDARVLELLPTPITTVDDRRWYDVDALHALIWRVTAGRPADAFVAIEWQHAMPVQFGSKDEHGKPMRTGGSKANFARGLGVGVWMTAFAMAGVPRERRLLVQAQAWQRVMLKGAPGDTTKARSIYQAKALWPSVSLVPPRARRDSDGFADALHVAAFGRMVHLGGPVFAAMHGGAAGARDVDIFRRAAR